MRISLIAIMVLAGVSAFADEPAGSVQRRVAIEKRLQEPLRWVARDQQKTVTLAELIEHIRQEHQLQIRWDLASLQMTFGEDSPLSELFGSTNVTHGMYAAAPLSLTPGRCENCTLPAAQYLNSPLQLSSDVQYVTATPYQPAPVSGNALIALELAAAPAAAAVVSAPQPLSPQSPAEYRPTTLQPAPLPAPATASDAPLVTNPEELRRLITQLQAILDAQTKTPAAPAAPAPAIEAAKPIPAAVPPTADAVPAAPSDDQIAAAADSESGGVLSETQQFPVLLSLLSLEDATVEEGLRQLLAATAAGAGAGALPMQMGLPISTRALNLDLLVDQNSVVITTQLHANSVKETRIYRLGKLQDLPAETLTRVITHSIRPWSWRSQATEIAETLASRWPKGMDIDLQQAVNSIAVVSGGAPAVVTPAAATVPATTADEAVAATGQLLAGGAVATVHSIVAALEIVHYGDPPTGVIETLPGILVITQSQSAHREIAALLEQLAEAE